MTIKFNKTKSDTDVFDNWITLILQFLQQKGSQWDSSSAYWIRIMSIQDSAERIYRKALSHLIQPLLRQQLHQARLPHTLKKCLQLILRLNYPTKLKRRATTANKITRCGKENTKHNCVYIIISVFYNLKITSARNPKSIPLFQFSVFRFS